MQIRLLFFSVLREIIKKSEITYEISENTSCETVLERLKKDYDIEEILKNSYLAKNGVYAFRDTPLDDGDELAILPPVSAP